MAALPRVGDTFGRYRIDDEIGRGGMGVVLGATDTSIGRTVALKVVSPHLGGSSEFQQRFEREAAVMARLDSPHVIAIYDYGTEDSCPYIATQYVAGGDLGALLATRGPMPAQLALKVCAQVADALGDAHRAGIVHRDVKPANVLLRDADDPHLHAYLCDFGIARAGDDGLTRAGAVAGTWSYLAPECGQGAPATPASDLYAVGCLLWALLSGAPPYRGTDVEIAVAHQHAPPPRLPGSDELSVRVNRILDLTLAKDPRRRYGSADALRADLLAAASLTTASGGPAPGIVPPPVGPPPVGGSHSGTGPFSGTGSYPGALSFGSLPPRQGPTTITGARPGRRRTAVVAALACAAVLAVTGGVVAATQLSGGDTTEAGASTSPDGADPGTEPPATDPTSPGTPAPPTRLDEGGPITGDRDGDGLGDLRVAFYHSIVTAERRPGGRPVDQDDPDNIETVLDIVTWTSDGTKFTDVETEREPAFEDGDRVVGDFDGDGVEDVVRLPAGRDEDRPAFRVVGELSGGGRIDDEVRKRDATAFVAVTDLDGDGADDFVLQYYTDYADPSSFTGVVVDGTRLRPERTLLADGPSPAVANFEVGDFDGDGRGDLAIVREAGDAPEIGDYRHSITLWLGTDDGTRRGPTTTFVGGFRPEPLAADVDGDEHAELVLLDGTTLRVADVRDGEITRPRAYGSMVGSKAAVAYGVSDVNGDGLDDVVLVQKLSDTKARLQAAVTSGRRFVTSSWGMWQEKFVTSEFYYRFTVDGRSFE